LHLPAISKDILTRNNKKSYRLPVTSYKGV
jgi:hypothetical protein